MSTVECRQCRTSEVIKVDGLFYCKECGVELQAMRDVENEMEAMTGFSYSARLTVPKAPKDPAKKEVRKKPLFRLLAHSILADKDYPGYLKQIGLRLATATYLVSRISYILQERFDCPAELTERSLIVFQIFLRSVGIAFTDKEIVGQNRVTNIATQKTMEQLIAERARINRRKQKKPKKGEKQSQLAWQPKSEKSQTQGDEDNLDAIIDTIQDNVSKLSVSAINAAARVFINVDVLLCIVFCGCHYSGVRWIMLSDLQRWHREDRFNIAGQHLINMRQATSVKTEQSTIRVVTSALSTSHMNTGTLSQCYRLLALFTRLMPLPRIIKPLDIETVCCRFIHDLNLPNDLWPRIEILLKLIPPVTDKGVSPSVKIEDIQEGLTKLRQGGPKSTVRYFFYDTAEETLVDMPLETKAVAIIMLALQLTCAIDEPPSQQTQPQNSQQDENEFFFHDWLDQLSFRTLIRRGKSADIVLSPTFTSNVLQRDRVLRQAELHSSVVINTIVADRTLTAASHKNFYESFPTEHMVLYQDTYNTDLAKFTPTRYHGMLYNSYYEPAGDDGQIDPQRLQTLLREFDQTTITPLQMRSQSATYDQHWRLMFPAFDNYKRIPLSIKWSRWHPDRTASVSTKFLRARLRDDRRFFSESFERLLHEMSTVVGDALDVTYLTFLLVEWLVLSRSFDIAGRTVGQTSVEQQQPNEELNEQPEEEWSELEDDVRLHIDESSAEDEDDEEDDEKKSTKNVPVASSQWRRRETALMKCLLEQYW